MKQLLHQMLDRTLYPKNMHETIKQGFQSKVNVIATHQIVRQQFANCPRLSFLSDCNQMIVVKPIMVQQELENPLWIPHNIFLVPLGLQLEELSLVICTGYVKLLEVVTPFFTPIKVELSDSQCKQANNFKYAQKSLKPKEYSSSEHLNSFSLLSISRIIQILHSH